MLGCLIGRLYKWSPKINDFLWSWIYRVRGVFYFKTKSFSITEINAFLIKNLVNQ